MQLKPGKVEHCKTCGAFRKIIPAAEGCDVCRTPFPYPDKGNGCLEIGVYYQGDRQTHQMKCCSWHCAIRALRKIHRGKHRSDYFVSLPFLYYDERRKGIRATDFFKAISEWTVKK